MAKFKGFTNQQTHQLLSELGYDGPVDTEMMDAFVAATPSAASMLGRYNEMARDRIEGRPMSMGFQGGGQIPDWVDPNYSYDPANPRKPNMREMMNAGLSTKDASEMLYGVVGSNTDTRNWNAIMASDNILSAAQQATGQMYSGSAATAENLKNSTSDIDKAH
jgi:hypothetical protein